MKHRLARMVQEAKTRRHDADILGASLDTRSDSQSFLRVLAFEVLLKAAVLASGESRATGHDYKILWGKLPPIAQAEVLKVASGRMPGHADLSDLDKLLFWFQFVFEQARYGYELYDSLTPEQVRELGLKWEERGAPINEARIQYYPSELECLTEGLIRYVEEAL
jgi:hypothetical protein